MIWFAWFGFVWSRLNRSDCLVQVLFGLARFTFVWSKLIWSGFFLLWIVWFRMVRSREGVSLSVYGGDLHASAISYRWRIAAFPHHQRTPR